MEAVFCCVGGGGLLAGVGAFLKAVKPEIKAGWGKGGMRLKNSAVRCATQVGFKHIVHIPVVSESASN